MPFNVNDLLSKPVYDVSAYGEDLQLALGTGINMAMQSITWSSIDELVMVDSDLENYSRLISDIDTLGILHEGDGVAFDHTFKWLTDMSAWVYKFNLTFAVGLTCTSYTSGNHNIDSVRVIFKELLPDGTELRTLADMTKATGLTALTATGTQVAIMTFENNTPFKIAQGNSVSMQVILNRTDTLVATTYEGIMPLFYFQEGSILKQMCESTLNLHLHPALDHAFPVFRDQSIQEGLDYDGVTVDGFDRSHSP